jgi:CubicO group peptidase (beta-lactamase class C family)
MSKPADLTRLLDEFVKNGPSGCGAAVAQNGKILFEGYAGLADLETRRPITVDTTYRLFSMTKVIICTAAMILYERGQFLLNEPIAQYIPEFAHPKVVVTDHNGAQTLVDAKDPMLVKHAFMMAVGLPYHFGDSLTAQGIRKVQKELTEKYGHYDVVTEAKAVGLNVPIAFEPGSHWLYGYGHDIVAALIQVISGKTVGQFLKDEIFTPLGMASTGYRFWGDMEGRMATMYQKEADGSLKKTIGLLDQYHRPEAKYEMGGAGLFSTVGDYLKFSQMLACGGAYEGKQIIGSATIDLMRTNHLSEVQLKDFQNSYLGGYGYGLGVRTMIDKAGGHSNTSLGEFGWTGAAGTYTFIDPSRGLSGVYMHQMSPNMEEFHHHRFRAVANGLAR